MKHACLFVILCCFTHQANSEDGLDLLVEQFCVECHNDSTTEGELDLASFVLADTSAELRARTLERIILRVSEREMPPADAETLDPEAYDRFLQHSQSELDRLAGLLHDDPGAVAMPRLTPYEYRNVVRDLSDGIVTHGGRLLPNEGGAGEGFANVGAAQVMTLPQYEKYIDAAKETLKHLRIYPLLERERERTIELSGTYAAKRSVVSSTTFDWTPYPRSPVDTPDAARKEVIDEIISWYVTQQQKWGAEHREQLEQQLGFVHAAYLEAAWNFSQRTDRNAELETFAMVNRRDPKSPAIKLAPAALKKWWEILNSEDAGSPHADWAKQWRKLAVDSSLSPAELRDRCVAIVAGNEDVVVETEDYAPEYEISFHEAKEEVLEAAEKNGHWPFRIEIGNAQELFLIVTDAGDGNRGEYAVWRRGRFVYRDGSSQRWQDVVTIVGARSGKEYPFGFDGEGSQVLGEDAVGAKPPGALKFTVPDNALVFEVELSLDENRSTLASIQALVLKAKPKSSSYIPGRFVFGGKKRPVTTGAKLKKEQERALRKRNVSEANKTKIGLNAERNVFSNWRLTQLESIGGPWPEQDADQFQPRFPYHYTVNEVLQNAQESDVAGLRRLEKKLASLVDDRDETLQRERAAGFIRPFARRAWRRDPSEGEIHSLLRLYDDARVRGLSFDSAVKSSLLLVLSSPYFIYKQYSAIDRESEDSEQFVALSSGALATRLAFFLWGSLPDDELLDLVDQDELRNPDVLRSQAQRMLGDVRARSLATDFAGQMWDFAGFDTFDNPDESRFPEFTHELRSAMQQEVEVFLLDLFQNDHPITNILSADYTFANDVLAKHYGLDLGGEPTIRRLQDEDRHSIAGTFDRVPLSSKRGGLSTMGLFLTKNSLPLRTSPVQRGVWVLENMLGRHLPNPPADVPSLSEDDKNEAGENIRQQLERHRALPSCASCHDKIDPLGLSLEGFDAIGRILQVEHDDNQSKGSFAEPYDGVALDGSVSLQAYLVNHQDEFIVHFNRKLLGYALGRSVHIGDRDLLERMRSRAEAEAFRFSVLVDEIVASPQFRMKRATYE